MPLLWLGRALRFLRDIPALLWYPENCIFQRSRGVMLTFGSPRVWRAYYLRPQSPGSSISVVSNVSTVCCGQRTR
jgi:hypothetical protein